MTSDETAITNLLNRYAESMDAGDLEAAAELFAHAEIVLAQDSPPVDARTLLSVWRRTVVIHDDGTPRTRHIVTNPIIEIHGDGTRATCRSAYTVFQQVGSAPLQAIVAGRYHDDFACVDGHWHFTRRDYSLVDLVGDVSQHLRIELELGGAAGEAPL